MADTRLHVHDGDGDAEDERVERRLRPLFREAFAAALGELAGRDKSLLRQHYLDGLTVDEVAALHRTHRAIAARWLASARQRLLDGTRRALMLRLHAPLPDCEGMIRLARSQLELTLHRLLTSR